MSGRTKWSNLKHKTPPEKMPQAQANYDCAEQRDKIASLVLEVSDYRRALERVPLPSLRDSTVFWEAYNAAQEALKKYERGNEES